MDDVKRAYYEVVFERDYLKQRGSTFQDFFSEIMEKRHHGDFIRVRPWGRAAVRRHAAEDLGATGARRIAGDR